MNNQHYLGRIIARFMTEPEQRAFDAKYKAYKIVHAGRDVIKQVEDKKKPSIRYWFRKAGKNE
jgi:hypothetical protein